MEVEQEPNVIEYLRSVANAAMETLTANQPRNDRHLSAFNLGLILGKGAELGFLF
jgi:hypothetical protein